MAVFQLKDMMSMAPGRSKPLFTSDTKRTTLAELDAQKKRAFELDKLQREEDYGQAQSDYILKNKGSNEKLQSELLELDEDDAFIAKKKAEAQSELKKDKESLERKEIMYKRAVAIKKVKDLAKALQSYQAGPKEIKAYNEAAAELKALGGKLPEGYTPDDIIAEYESKESQSDKANYESKLKESEKYDNYSSKEPRVEIASEIKSNDMTDIKAKKALADPFDIARVKEKSRTDADIVRALKSSPEARAAKAKYDEALIEESEAIAAGDEAGKLAARKKMITADTEFYNATDGLTLKIDSSSRLASASESASKSKKMKQEVEKGELELAKQKDEVKKAITDDVGKIAGDWMSANSKLIDTLAAGNNFRKVFNSFKAIKKPSAAQFAMMVKAVNKMMEPTAGVMADDMKTIAAFGGDTGGKFEDMSKLGSSIVSATNSVLNELAEWAGITPDGENSNVDIVLELRKKAREEEAQLFIDQWDEIKTTGQSLANTSLQLENNIKADLSNVIGNSQDYSNFRNTNALAAAGGQDAKTLFSTEEGKAAFNAAVQSKLNASLRSTFNTEMPKTETAEVKETEVEVLKEGKRRKSKTWPGFMEIVVNGKWIKDTKIKDNSNNTVETDVERRARLAIEYGLKG